jgi:hypothetical protein
LFPTSTSAIPLLLEGLLSQPCTVCVMSISRKLFTLLPFTVIGFDGEAEGPKVGDGEPQFKFVSDHPDVTSYTSNCPLA